MKPTRLRRPILYWKVFQYKDFMKLVLMNKENLRLGYYLIPRQNSKYQHLRHLIHFTDGEKIAFINLNSDIDNRLEIFRSLKSLPDPTKIIKECQLIITDILYGYRDITRKYFSELFTSVSDPINNPFPFIHFSHSSPSYLPETEYLEFYGLPLPLLPLIDLSD